MSDYELLKNCLSIGVAKEAAIYFDFVIPFDLSAGITMREDKHCIAVNKNFDNIVNCLMPNIENAGKFYSAYSAISNGFWSFIAIRKWYFENGSMDGFLDLDQEYLNIIDQDLGQAYGISLSSALRKSSSEDEYLKIRSEYNRMLNNGLRSLNVDRFSEWHDEFYEPALPNEQRNSTRSASVVAVLQNMELVNADKLSWEKIVAIRKDKRSVSALRDLRLFLYRESGELEQDALIDLISSHYEKYQTAVKWWKLETVKKPLSMMVSKQGIGLTSLGAIGTFLTTGVPVDPTLLIGAAKAALASGTALNVAGVGALSLHESYMERDKLNQTSGSEVRYLAYLNKMSGKG